MILCNLRKLAPEVPDAAALAHPGATEHVADGVNVFARPDLVRTPERVLARASHDGPDGYDVCRRRGGGRDGVAAYRELLYLLQAVGGDGDASAVSDGFGGVGSPGVDGTRVRYTRFDHGNCLLWSGPREVAASSGPSLFDIPIVLYKHQ